ncbi:hypothetical protein [Nocardioides sp. cx-173]|uniref:hypothetical protein n=1 Tax=Nocardioides sp. cx-173 TaxID=2898796 RepID=UPI001E44712A|nr:hypothetical protein [Nocardioides sp. cx-173]MCD4524684.1 hypothetical protein [Nocardioides sp. cx-173]UGB43194.1 hypothetical protein LQ940_06610 [Nocardioides sp. cx-173]
MTQATQGQSAPAPASAPAHVRGSVPASAAAHAPGPAAGASTVEDTPRLLNRLQALAVAACVLFGLVAALLQLLAWQATGRAADNTEQVVRVQQIQSSLFRADALATNAFLVGGLEDAEQRAEYDDAIEQALRGIAGAAEAQPADRKVLADLNTEVAAYASGITQARDNNRQGFPIGAQYLREAGAGLRADAVPILQALVDANAERADEEMNGQNTLPLLLAGVAAVAVLWWVNRELARRFRRRVNVGLAVAALAITLLTLVGAVVSAGKSGDNDDLRAGSFERALQESRARTAANDAKAEESLRLIARGSGAAAEPRWDERAEIVEESASADTLGRWSAYADKHAVIIETDDEGDWSAAVDLATTTEPGSASAALTEFDQASQEVVAQAADETSDSLRSGGITAWMLIVVSLLVGLGSAGAVAWGVNQRRREYA